MVRAVVAVVLAGFLLVGGPFVVVGLFLVRRAVDEFATNAAIRRRPLETVADVQAGNRTKLTGTAQPATASGEKTRTGATGETGAGGFAAAFTGAPALAARYEIYEHRPDTDGGTDRRTIHDSVVVVPFRLVDGAGSVAVDPEPPAVECSDANLERVEVRAGERPPERIRAYVEATDDLDRAAPGVALGPVDVGGRRHTYVERTIRPGDQVVVVGPVDRDPEAPWGDSLVVRPAADGTDLVTDRPLDDIGTYGLVVVAGYLLAGVALVVGPLVVLGAMLLELGIP